MLVGPLQAQVSNDGTLVVVKDATPSTSDSFNFTGPSGSFSLTGDGTSSSSQSFTLAAGTYNVTELVPTGWEISAIDCTSNVDLRIAPTNDSVSAQVTSGQTTTCTFVNVELGSITVVLDATPNSPDVFNLTGTLGAFTLTDDGTASNTRTFDNVTIVGSRSIELTVPPGWVLTASGCTGQDIIRHDRILNVPDNPLTPNLIPSQEITCTFSVRDERVDLNLTKELLTGNPSPGGLVEWQITASNAGPGDAGDVPLSDTIPSGVSGITWSCVGRNGGLCDNDTASETGSGDLNEDVDLPAAGSVVYNLIGTLAADFQGELINAAALDLNGLSVVETSPNDNADEARGIVGIVSVPVQGALGRLGLVTLLALLGIWALRRI